MGRRLSQWEGGAELSGQPAASTPFSKTRDKDRWPPRAADNSRACLTSLHFMWSDGSARESSSGLPIRSCSTSSHRPCWLWGLVSPSTCRQACGRLPLGSLGASGCGLGVGCEDSGEGNPRPAPSAFPREETGAHQLRFFAQSCQFREQLGLNAAPGGTPFALSRTCHSLTLPVCLFPVLQGLFQGWPWSDVGRWVSWLPLACGRWQRLPLLPPLYWGFCWDKSAARSAE